jgi:ribosomal protein S18
MGRDKEINELQMRMEILKHVGFCMAEYDKVRCYDCPTEFECMKLFIKERDKVNPRTITKMEEVQDGKPTKL